MFRDTYQSGFLSIFYAIGNKPLRIWGKQVKNGHIKRITDPDIKSVCLEICGNNVSTTYIQTPPCPNTSLGVRLPFLVIVVKNLKRYFSFEVEILDDTNVKRRFRSSNFASHSSINPFNCSMPLRLDDGWNQIHVNMADFTRRAYGTGYVETTRVQIHANCRLRRIYFCENLCGQQNMPSDFRVFVVNANSACPGGPGMPAPGGLGGEQPMMNQPMMNQPMMNQM